MSTPVRTLTEIFAEITAGTPLTMDARVLGDGYAVGPGFPGGPVTLSDYETPEASSGVLRFHARTTLFGVTGLRVLIYLEGETSARRAVVEADLSGIATLAVLNAYTADPAPLNTLFSPTADPAYFQNSALTAPIGHFLFGYESELTAPPPGFDARLSGAREGWNTHWNLSFAGDLGNLLTVVGVVADLTVRVRVYRAQDGLRAEFTAQSTWSGTAAGFHVEVTDLSVIIRLNAPSITPALELRGALSATGLPRFAVIVRVDPALNRLSCEADNLDLAVPAPTDFAATLGLGTLSDYLPHGAVLSALTLQQMRLEFSVAPVGLRTVEVTIGSDHEITLPGNFLSIQPMLSITVQEPLDVPNRVIDTVLTGRWRVGDGALDVTVDVTNRTFSVELAQGAGLDGAALQTTLAGGLDWQGLTLIDFEAEGSYTEDGLRFAAELDVRSDWVFSLGGHEFGLRETRLALIYDRGVLQDLNLAGWIVLADLAFDVSAEYYHSTGWLVRAAARPEGELRVGTLLESLAADLTGLTHLDVGLPPAFRSLTIQGLYFEKRIGTQSFVFQAQLNHVLEIGDAFRIERVFLRAAQSSRTLALRGVLWLRLAGVDLTLLAESTAPAGYRFSGGTLPGSTIAIGALLADLGRKFGIEEFPAFLEDMTLSNLSVSYLTESGEFEFACDGQLPFASATAQLRVTIAMRATRDTQGAITGHAAFYSGTLTINAIELTLDFNNTIGTSRVHARYARENQPLALTDVGGLLGLDLSAIPSEIAPTLRTLDLVYETAGTVRTASLTAVSGSEQRLIVTARDAGTGWRYLVGLDLHLNLVIDGIGTIGIELSEDHRFELRQLTVLYASAALAADEVQGLRAGLDPTVARVFPDTAIADGLGLTAEIRYAGTRRPLTLGPPSQTDPASATPDVVRPPLTDDVRWLSIQKQLGPLYFGRVGFVWRSGKLVLLLDVALMASAVRIALDGLSAGFPLRLPPGAPDFGLNGLEITIDSGPLEISGGLRRVALPHAAASDFRYDGSLRVLAPGFALDAIGSYARLGGEPALFLFAFLGRPLGGPPSFFVTGLALGGGYHTRLALPAIDNLADFSLLKGVLAEPGAGGFSNGESADSALNKLSADIVPDTESQWLAAGVRFTSFEMLRSFALLTINPGPRFQLALLGISHASLPPRAGDPIAFAELALIADFSPAGGRLRVEGRLTRASYVLSRDCHLYGGFAFYTWLSGEHAGDFVLTLGGYHPRFAPPAHYPRVPRLGFHWQLDSHLSISGDAYFALTPLCLMAGGHLNVNYELGDLHAWFDNSADFLLYWKPFHYEADFHVSLGASYTVDLWLTSFSVTVHVGVDVHLWGPAFGGTAEVDLSVFSFTISFGDSQPVRAPISWAEFKASFLPRAGASDTVVDVRVESGLLTDRRSLAGRAPGEPDYIVHPDQLVLATYTMIPGKRGVLDRAGIGADGIETNFSQTPGVNPVAIPAAEFVSDHRIRVEKFDDASATFVSTLPEEPGRVLIDDFEITARRSSAPAALWLGTAGEPDLNAARLIPDTLAGYTLRPKTHRPDETADAALEVLAYEHTSRERTITVPQPTLPAADDFGASYMQGTLTFQSGGTTHTNTNFVLSAVAAAPSRGALLTALAAQGLSIPTTVDVSRLATATVLDDWPLLARPGQTTGGAP